MAAPHPPGLSSWGRDRGPVVGAALLLGLLLPLLLAWSAPVVGAGDAGAQLRAVLQRDFALTVAGGDLAWERAPSRGFGDALAGTRALFLARGRSGAPRDLYRAGVRLTPEGRVLAVEDPVNLTHTGFGDDHALSVRGPWAAFATSAYGGVQAVTILDLRGEPEAALAALDGPARARRSVTDLLATGVFAGVGRTIVRLDPAPAAVRLAWSDHGRLEIDAGAGAVVRVDARGAILRDGTGATVDRVVHDPQPMILWAVETVRSVVGPAPIAWLEARTFALADLGRRIEHGAVTPSRASPASTRRHAPPPPTAPVGWPPPDVPARLEPSVPGEGRWRASAPDFVARMPGAPPAFYETFVRPDAARPYVKVHLVAMDMRQLALGVVAGAEDPEPTVGPPGTGRLPHQRQVVETLVAAFNGAFKTKHGEYGMIQDRRVLLPPMRRAATILTRSDGRIGVGSWPGDWHVSSDVVSLRQNLDPLVDRGVLNPSGRRLWGFPLPGMDAMQTQRSGLCVDRGGNLLYFYGADLSGPLLGEAMISASCSYGIHLDMNPYHCAFVYTRIRDPDAWLEANDRMSGRSGALAELYDATTIARGMMDPKRYLIRSPKDFFYLTLRTTMLERPSYRLEGGPL